jgi:nucleoside-diphosphate kinase
MNKGKIRGQGHQAGEMERLRTMQRTFSIIKPDAVAKGAVGHILRMIEGNGFRIVGMKMLTITRDQAKGFCAVHANRPFFDALTRFLSSDPIVVLALEKENAIADFRNLIGATNPINAGPGTIRKRWGESTLRNAIHGSDSEDTARSELNYFFSRHELPQ